MPETKERSAFSIDASIKHALELAVPKSKRSRFVEKAIAQALENEARAKAAEAIRNGPSYAGGGKGTLKALREVRERRRQALVARHAKAGRT